jgi:hypothetical protein
VSFLRKDFNHSAPSLTALERRGKRTQAAVSELILSG